MKGTRSVEETDETIKEHVERVVSICDDRMRAIEQDHNELELML